jgi:8-oxo-dGTP pyrophosphatase MutT (NUDIX family)
MNKLLTVCVILDGNRVLLGRKKRGFGTGLWNGFGGKLMPGETLEQGAVRETREEAGIEVKNLLKRGVIIFEFKGNPVLMEVHFWSTSDFSGTPVETEEMAPQWFDTAAIPYDQMFADDRYWFPLLLAGKNFAGTASFTDEYTMLHHDIHETDNVR